MQNVVYLKFMVKRNKSSGVDLTLNIFLLPLLFYNKIIIIIYQRREKRMRITHEVAANCITRVTKLFRQISVEFKKAIF